MAGVKASMKVENLEERLVDKQDSVQVALMDTMTVVKWENWLVEKSVARLAHNQVVELVVLLVEQKDQLSVELMAVAKVVEKAAPTVFLMVEMKVVTRVLCLDLTTDAQTVEMQEHKLEYSMVVSKVWQMADKLVETMVLGWEIKSVEYLEQQRVGNLVAVKV